MVSRVRLGASIVLTLSVASLFFLLPGLLKESAWALGRFSRAGVSSPGPVAGYDDRIESLLAAKMPDKSSLFVLRSDSSGMHAVDRARAQLAFWNRCPLPVRFGAVGEIGDAEAVLAADGGNVQPKWSKAGLNGDSFSKVGSTGYRGLWIRKDVPTEMTGSRRSVGVFREAVGLIPVLIVMALGLRIAGCAGSAVSLWLFSVLMSIPPIAGFPTSRGFVVFAVVVAMVVVFRFFRTIRPCTEQRNLAVGCLALALFLFLSFLALSHLLLPPNGLAVVGGKAKLWYLAGGFPDGYFTDPAWRLAEPAYPPGPAAVVLSCFAFSGGCGDWLVQLTGCVAMALTFASAAKDVEDSSLRGWIVRFWLLSLFLHPLVLKMGSQLYPESFMALCVVAGWRRIARSGSRDDFFGWFLLGSAGWFKTEGLVFAGVAWFALVFAGGCHRKSSFLSLLAGISLPVAWHVAVRLSGGSFNDFAPLLHPDGFQGWFAFVEAFRLSFCEPYHYAFVYPVGLLSAIAVFVPTLRRKLSGDHLRGIVAALFFSLLCTVCFSFIFSYSRAFDYDWHVSTALPRLLWTPALVLGIVISRSVLPRLTTPRD